MEVELEPRVKPLSYKVKGISRESPAQKAAHVLDNDLRNHWSTGTNTKEWILLELDEPCLLSHVRIYNKSVLEWEISVGLRYKPETFVKVRPRCEAPRRDMVYPMNYSPCRYVRISCLRGNPIAIFFIQLIGVPVTGLEPEFQPVVNHLLPQIISQKQDAHDMHLRLLQDMVGRLVTFLPQIEVDLNSFSEAAEPTLRFLAMLSGPFYPILRMVNERETAKISGNLPDSEPFKNGLLPMAFTVSSNFEPRRLRNASVSLLPTSSYLIFRPDVVFTMLRKAYKEPNLGKVCRMVSAILLKMTEAVEHEVSSPNSNVIDVASKSEPSSPFSFVDYSDLFGEEFLIPDGNWETSYLNILDVKLVEEGLLHLLYASASQPFLCNKLADSCSDLWLALPLIQALVPALRPNISSPDQVDENFSQWKQPLVQHALSEIVATSSSAVFRPLLRACAGYLSSFSPSHAKAACVLIDLCSGVLAPWVAQVIAKVDLAVELLEDLFGDIQGAFSSFAHARAALKYIVLALSGNMDDVMSKYKDVKHQILFLVEMLEPFLDPAMAPVKSIISFGNVSSTFLEKQDQNCAIALNVLRIAVSKPAVLPSLEAEWRCGSVSPSILLSILEPHMQLPPDIDLRQYPTSGMQEKQSTSISTQSSAPQSGGASSTPNSQEDADGRTDNSEVAGKMDPEEASFLFAPSELSAVSLTCVSRSQNGKNSDISHSNINIEENDDVLKNSGNQLPDNHLPNNISTPEHPCLIADYFQLMNYTDSELKASEFRRFALDLHSQTPLTPEGHSAAIDALLLAAECYVNPYFMMSFQDSSQAFSKENVRRSFSNWKLTDIRKVLEKNDSDLKLEADLERERDKAVLKILLEAAELDLKYQKTSLDVEPATSYAEENEESVNLSQDDVVSADAITLVRLNQKLLCNFLIKQLQRDQQSMHEILMQSLLFLLHSATKLFCAPELVVDIILKSAEFFNMLLKSLFYQSKEGSLQLSHFKLHEVQRRWMLLQRLVFASSGSDEESNFSINAHNSFRFANLIPPSAWLQKIPVFASSASPLVRHLGWMAVSRNAKQYIKERLYLASDLSQLTYLLSIFSDDLTLMGNIAQKEEERKKDEEPREKDLRIWKGFVQPQQQYDDQSFTAIYPEISQFFPSLKKHFESFGESILEAVGLQLKSLSSAIVPDLMCWFSDLCSWPFLQKRKDLKGFTTKNAKAVIHFILESILSEHMEAMVPEIPRLVQMLASLCRSSYCDVAFLDSILHLLKPLISYSLHKAFKEEHSLGDGSCLNFESLCFSELLGDIKDIDGGQGHAKGNDNHKALTVFVLASVLPDLSFHGKTEILQSSLFCADFASYEPTTYFHDYLCAYQILMDSCKSLLIQMMRECGAIPVKRSMDSDANIESCDDCSESCLQFLLDICDSSTEVYEKLDSNSDSTIRMNEKVFPFSTEEVEIFLEKLDYLIDKLSLTLDLCFKVHHKLAKKLIMTSAECFIYSKFLLSMEKNLHVLTGIEKESVLHSNLVDESPTCWNFGLEEFAEMLLVLQEKHCWEVGSVILDCLLSVPQCFCLDSAVEKICSAIKHFSCNAPNISWRLQTDRWMSSLFRRGVHLFHKNEMPFVDLFCSMLKNPEPEQRFIAVKHLRKLVSHDMEGGVTLLSSNSGVVPSDFSISCALSFSSAFVSSTWDQVVYLSSSDSSMLIRTHSMALLLHYIPLAGRPKLQSLLTAADNILQSLTNLLQPTCEGPIPRFSLALLANICLHSPAEDISLVPDIIWSSIESFGMLENEKCPVGSERKICQALCRLRTEEDEAKQMLKEVLSSTSSEQPSPEFGSTRESILQVISNFTSAQSYFDFFSKEIDKKALELEEAEIEMELLQKEHVLQDASNDIKDLFQLPFLADYIRDDKRLQQIKDGIRSLEKTKLREDIVARRQKKILLRCARQKYLEEAALREAELLQELDRKRTSEVEREIERQRLLELERAKTRELQHNVDMEREKQTQRELQRELEHVESGAGTRASRREFSSSAHSRPRYRERENGRASSGGQPDTSTSSSSIAAAPKVVLSGARQFSGQVPTILQSQERADEYGSGYEENFDGSKDSGDTGSVGDPEIGSGFEGQSIAFSSTLRHGSRGSKSRQILERRERDSRRESKWERKH